MIIKKKKILFLCEAVTLAHKARCSVLASFLDPDKYEVIFYSSDAYDAFFPAPGFENKNLKSMTPAEFAKRLSRGSPLYDDEITRAYLAEELQILDTEKPDLVIGDFRITLQVSTKIRNIPYLNITNFLWSPYANRPYLMPPIPISKVVGFKIGDFLLANFSSHLMKPHCTAVNKIRVENGLESFGTDLERIYTEGDYVVYCDLPALYPGDVLPETHRYIGPVMWVPDIDLPEWWDTIPQDKPIIYINLGSSGDKSLLPDLCRAIHDTGKFTLIVGAVSQDLSRIPSGVYAAPYIPSDQASELADIVICNGGAPSSTLAISNGAYCIGVCSNMDQLLNMGFIEKAGVGKSFRSVKSEVSEIVEYCSTRPQISADKTAFLQKEFQSWPAQDKFTEFIEFIL